VTYYRVRGFQDTPRFGKSLVDEQSRTQQPGFSLGPWPGLKSFPNPLDKGGHGRFQGWIHPTRFPGKFQIILFLEPKRRIMYFSNKSNYCINGTHTKAFKVLGITRKIANSTIPLSRFAIGCKKSLEKSIYIKYHGKNPQFMKFFNDFEYPY